MAAAAMSTCRSQPDPLRPHQKYLEKSTCRRPPPETTAATTTNTIKINLRRLELRTAVPIMLS